MFQEIIENLGDKKYRIDQFENAIFRELVDNFEQISVLPKELREKIAKYDLFKLKLIKLHISNDQKTVKALLKTFDNAIVESVMMKHEGRNTACISTQIGCVCGCKFCATGQQVIFKRNLDAQEIVEQVLFWNRYLKGEFVQKEKGEWKAKSPLNNYRIRNVVFMGMGEPFYNYDNVISAIHIFNDDKKFGIGQRHITISTCGIIPMIKKFAQLKSQINLAISLHASNDKLRSEIMPINNKFSFQELLNTLWDYVNQTNRRVFFEYTTIKDLNDKEKNAHELGKILTGHLAHVNFIPLNENPLIPLFKKSKIENIRKMQKILLENYGVVSTIRTTYGDDIFGACGQLAGEEGFMKEKNATQFDT